jgi:general secretion pathway protein G
MKRGFTMIELVFVIVILGILASIAIPRLAASRDDARAVSLKQDISTLVQAVPAWYQGQREVSVENAMSIDTTLWQFNNNFVYRYTDGQGGTITASLVRFPVGTTMTTALAATTFDPIAGNDAKAIPHNSTLLDNNEPWLIVRLNEGTQGIVRMLVRDMNVTNQTIPMAGRRVVWN